MVSQLALGEHDASAQVSIARIGQDKDRLFQNYIMCFSTAFSTLTRLYIVL